MDLPCFVWPPSLWASPAAGAPWLLPKQWFSTVGSFVSKVYLAMSPDFFGCHCQRDSEWVETWDNAKYPIMHKTAPATKNYLGQHVNNTETEPPWSKPSSFFKFWTTFVQFQKPLTNPTEFSLWIVQILHTAFHHNDPDMTMCTRLGIIQHGFHSQFYLHLWS